MKNTKVKSLSAAITLGFSAMMCQSVHASEKQVGDLEIYKASDDGTVKLMMMLDTSGSMSERIVMDGSACELPTFKDGFAVYELVQSTSETTPSYTRYSCKVNYKKRRYVYARVGNTYYECADVVCDRVSRAISQPRDIASYQSTQKAVGGFSGGYYYTGNVYYKPDVSVTEAEKEKYPNEVRKTGEIADRLTRLKDALFAVLDSDKIDGSKTFIGVGQYSTQSDSNNRRGTPDGATGKILVPSLVLDDTQKRRIKDAIVGLEGGAGTPSAMAYAEAGAYILGTTTVTPYARSGFNNSVAMSKSGSNYISPIPANPKTCDGHGIYFLTDGEPNSSVRPEELMKKALGNRSGSFVIRNSLPNGRSDGHGTPQVGAFARSLRIANDNPKGVSIRTAVVGFGTVFDTSQYKGIEKMLRKPILDNATGLPTGEFEDGAESKYIDCSLIQSVDARNACNWGAKSHPELKGVGGFGEGGFYSAQSTQDVIDSVVEFVGSLNTTIETTPSGTISIPSDPLNALTIQPYAYLPMMQPKVGEADAVWQGNLRKYHTLFGTLFGRGATRNEAGQRLYRPDPARATRGNERFPAHLDPRSLDLWQVGGSDSASVETGGARSHLNAGAVSNEPNLKNKTSRVVYVEAGSVDTPTLVKVQIVNGKFVIDDIGQLVARGYSIEDMAYLADYLGFSVPKGATYEGGDLQAQIAKLDEVIANTEMRSTPVFGGVNHSVPVLASYRGEYDEDTGNISSNADRRTDFILYGSMDGALHMTNADTGQESFAFIPREMFVSQRTALASDGSSSNGIGRPHFGVDAPWATRASYTYNDAGVTASSMMAYGGLRMGGKGFYGLNLDSATMPKLAFAISDKTTNFERLGQTWAKPTFTKIKTGSGANDFRDVVVFGGGYDMCYENPRFRLTTGTADPDNTDLACNNKTQAEGNAIYMVDAKTGAFIARWQASVATAGVGAITDDRNEMRHSFVSEIIPLDRNNNGFVDSLYASDLGGQLFRIDLREGVTGNDMTRRVVRVFDANSNLPADMLPMRFYERPSVSFYDHAGGTLAMVNIASGDRSSPLHTHRDTVAKANRIYGIIDRDLPTFRIAQPGSGHLTSRNLTNNNLQEYNTSSLQSIGNTGRLALIDALRDGSRQGWWYPMTRFETDTRVKHLKAIGSSVVTGSVFYTSIYSPDYQYTRDVSCAARIVGSTERQMFCLPWGICASPENGALFEESPNGTLGYSKAGPGIQEIATSTVTAQVNESTGYKTIIGMQTLVERAEDGRRTGSSTGAEGSNAPMKTEIVDGAGRTESANTAPGEVIVEMSKVLKVDRWYDLATAEANQ